MQMTSTIATVILAFCAAQTIAVPVAAPNYSAAGEVSILPYQPSSTAPATGYPTGGAGNNDEDDDDDLPDWADDALDKLQGAGCKQIINIGKNFKKQEFWSKIPTEVQGKIETGLNDFIKDLSGQGSAQQSGGYPTRPSPSSTAAGYTAATPSAQAGNGYQAETPENYKRSIPSPEDFLEGAQDFVGKNMCKNIVEKGEKWLKKQSFWKQLPSEAQTGICNALTKLGSGSSDGTHGSRGGQGGNGGHGNNGGNGGYDSKPESATATATGGYAQVTPPTGGYAQHQEGGSSSTTCTESKTSAAGYTQQTPPAEQY